MKNYPIWVVIIIPPDPLLWLRWTQQQQQNNGNQNRNGNNQGGNGGDGSSSNNNSNSNNDRAANILAQATGNPALASAVGVVCQGAANYSQLRGRLDQAN